MTAIKVTARLLLATLVATVIAACGAPPPTAIELETLGSPPVCTEALLQGSLIRTMRTGVGLRDGNGDVWQVIWPFGYSALDDGGRMELLDPTGTVLAHEGDLVTVGGGLDAGLDVGGGLWIACGGIVPP